MLASIEETGERVKKWTLKQVQGDGSGEKLRIQYDSIALQPRNRLTEWD
jgi:hypothetical protein